MRALALPSRIFVGHVRGPLRRETMGGQRVYQTDGGKHKAVERERFDGSRKRKNVTENQSLRRGSNIMCGLTHTLSLFKLFGLCYETL